MARPRFNDLIEPMTLGNMRENGVRTMKRRPASAAVVSRRVPPTVAHSRLSRFGGGSSLEAYLPTVSVTISKATFNCEP
jgi:hypothetical protein